MRRQDPMPQQEDAAPSTNPVPLFRRKRTFLSWRFLFITALLMGILVANFVSKPPPPRTKQTTKNKKTGKQQKDTLLRVGTSYDSSSSSESYDEESDNDEDSNEEMTQDSSRQEDHAGRSEEESKDEHQTKSEEKSDYSEEEETERSDESEETQDSQDDSEEETESSDQEGSQGDHDDDETTISWNEARKGKERILELLANAGITKVDLNTLQQLPTWEQVVTLYGEGPVIHGLGQCKKFRETIPKDGAAIGPAGMFNTGTNALEQYLRANCYMPYNKGQHKYKGMLRQVPWGKHLVASLKYKNTAPPDSGWTPEKDNVLPVVMTRDPYFWMGSVCRNRYNLSWEHGPGHCPNLVPNDYDYENLDIRKGSTTIPVKLKKRARKHAKKGKITLKYPSMVHVWTSYYHDYKRVEYPRLFARFEDLVFYPRQLIETICKCAGAKMKKAPEGDFTYLQQNSKSDWSGKRHDEKDYLIRAMIKYGTGVNRLNNFTRDDLQFAAENLDAELMDYFQYTNPKLPP